MIGLPEPQCELTLRPVVLMMLSGRLGGPCMLQKGRFITGIGRIQPPKSLRRHLALGPMAEAQARYKLTSSSQLVLQVWI